MIIKLGLNNLRLGSSLIILNSPSVIGYLVLLMKINKKRRIQIPKKVIQL